MILQCRSRKKERHFYMTNCYVQDLFHPKDEVEEGFITDLLIYFCFGEMKQLKQIAADLGIKVSKNTKRVELIVQLVEKMREPLKLA